MADPTRIAFGRGEIAQAAFIAIYAAIAWFAPNTQAIMGYDHEQPDRRREARRAGRCGRCSSTPPPRVLAFGILGIQQHSEFIYFRF